ncbi:MAG TPA: peptidase M24 [Porphyromonadaceae bacterium]|nr:peptidase M24 [Porphyromonadaceae bacterium]
MSISKGNNALSLLREWMKKKNLDAFIVPIADPHGSEYVCEHYHTLQWLIGFTGSAGTMVATQEECVFWTDSRYHVQAGKELNPSEVTLVKENSPSLEMIASWLSEHMLNKGRLGIEGSLFSYADVEKLSTILTPKGIIIESKEEPFEEIWKECPLLPQNPFYIYEERYAGESAEHKLQRLRTYLREQNGEGMVISDLYEIAWLLNLRGSDVECNPVGIAYLYITLKGGYLFTFKKKITNEVQSYLQGLNISIREYNEVFSFIHSIKEKNILCDKEHQSFCIIESIPKECRMISLPSIITQWKALKNEVEIEGTKQAMIEDGIALVKALMFLEREIQKGELTEFSFSQKLRDFKKERKGFMDESFNTIASYQSNGAICHYRPPKENSSTLFPKGFFLLDTGTQYLFGTTDITRTFALGTLTEEQKRDYTLVLRGHLALSLLHFPKDTYGDHIDALAHYYLWQKGLDYFHGTGHGVGHFLGVHEGPQRISLRIHTPLRNGMIVSNEPGLYREGFYGIRIENLVLVSPSHHTEFGEFSTLETLTLFPYERKAIIKEILSKEEVDYINGYHQKVCDKLSPFLNEEERNWLLEKTQPL